MGHTRRNIEKGGRQVTLHRTTPHQSAPNSAMQHHTTVHDNITAHRNTSRSPHHQPHCNTHTFPWGRVMRTNSRILSRRRASVLQWCITAESTYHIISDTFISHRDLSNWSGAQVKIEKFRKSKNNVVSDIGLLAPENCPLPPRRRGQVSESRKGSPPHL